MPPVFPVWRMPLLPIDAFIFDMDDVVCTYDVGRRISALASLSGRPETEIRQAIWESDFLDRADRGYYSADAYLDEFGRLLGMKLNRAQWVEARRASMIPDLPMLNLVRALGQSHRLALLTNNDRLLSETIDDLFPELRHLFGSHLYVSADLALAKPDPDIFRAVCNRVGAETRRSFFIDDLAVNVAGAKEAGLQGHVFKGVTGFLEALKYAGITVTHE